MTFQQFCNHIESNIVNYLPDEQKTAKIQIMSVTKSNSVELTSLTILSEGKSIAPTIYLSGYYNDYLNGRGLHDIIETIVKVYLNACIKSETYSYIVDDFRNYNNIKDRIIMIVINKDRNKELLNKIPHRAIEDLAIIYKVLVEKSDEIATILIHNEHLINWGVDETNLYEQATKNTKILLPTKVERLFDKMIDLGLDEDLVKECVESTAIEDTQFIVSNSTRMNGAVKMFDTETLSEIAEKTGSDLYILPSSIHEIIVVSVNCGLGLDGLREIVSEVNKTELTPDEYLSDNVYFFNAKTKEVSIAVAVK